VVGFGLNPEDLGWIFIEIFELEFSISVYITSRPLHFPPEDSPVAIKQMGIGKHHLNKEGEIVERGICCG